MACRLVVLTLALQALQGLFLASGSVHPGYTIRDGTSYKVFTETKSHYEAERTCEADGGHLVDIKTESLHNFILDMVRAVNPYRLQDYWIGLNDKRTYNVWTWSDGTLLGDCGFTKWAPGEPNNGFGWGQDCGQLWAARQLRWDDDFCNILKGFICQIGPGENGTCSGGGCHVANGGCAQICTSDGPNTRCDCRIGYVLSDDGHNCTVYTKHCMFGNGATYRGTVSMTSANQTCQRWDSQTPHPHDQTVRHPLAGLDENYCRNPDGEPRPWCYTTDPAIRWQYCSLPQCFSDCYIDDGTSYRGTVNITSSGRACQRWDSQTPHPHTRTPTSYPSAGLDENFCRNPDGEAEPWCYTQDPYVKWEACVISKCDGKGITTTATTSERIKILSRQHRFPNTELSENYCRNPDGWDRPWCYTTDPNIRWQVCDIPGCCG
ncbi:plasminogen-like [Branchiostoma floridae]|uniref:Plasminogen-like n=1 Tax=Branchiostoma floridae TaxID=7739 RepID=A0A9J7LJ16_BRAFL|nr:plasminogen-like [Branchiostoma floridae]